MRSVDIMDAVDAVLHNGVAPGNASKSGHVIAHGDQTVDDEGYLVRSPHDGTIEHTALLSLPRARVFASMCVDHHNE